MYTYSNFAKSTVQNNPLAIGGTSLTLDTGDGAKFPSSGTFTIVIWGSAYGNPTGDSTAEICTATRSGDVLTITRGQEGTSAKEWAQDSNVAHILTAGGIDEIIDSIKNGAIPYDGTMPTFTSTTSGVDTVSFAGVDVTTEFKRGAKVRVVSGAGTHWYDCVDSSFSTNTTVKLAGETSVSGTITAISYSYADNPQGYKKGEDYYRMNAKRTSNQTVNDAASTKVQLDTEVFDTNSDYDNVTNYRWTCPVSGIYTVSLGGVMYDSTNVMVSAFASIYKNGVEDQRSHFQPGGTNATRLPASLTKLMKLNRGDYIEFFVNIDTNDSGTAEIALDPFMSIMFDGIAEA